MELTHPIFRRRITVLRWVLPLLFVLLAVFYQLGLARWAHDSFGDNAHYAVEILFYSGIKGGIKATNIIGKW